MNYIKVSQAVDKWGFSARHVRVLCAENKITGVIGRGKLYMIPEDAPRPIDNRQFNSKFLPEQFASLFKAIDTKSRIIKTSVAYSC